MEYFPFYIVHQTNQRYSCIPYPTFAEVLATLDELQPNFGWTEKFSQPLSWLCGNARPLDSITIDWFEFLLPESLCIIFDIPPTWVWTFCEEVLRALEDARAQAVRQHCESHLDCPECHGLLKAGASCVDLIFLNSWHAHIEFCLPRGRVLVGESTIGT